MVCAMPPPPAHLVFMLYTCVAFLTLALVANAYSFECVA